MPKLIMRSKINQARRMPRQYRLRQPEKKLPRHVQSQVGRGFEHFGSTRLSTCYGKPSAQ